MSLRPHPTGPTLPGLHLPPHVPNRDDAERLATKLVRQIARELRSIKCTLSGDDSPLRNAWDELCVQQQMGDAFETGPCRHTLAAILAGVIDRIDERGMRVLWILTPNGSDWYYDVTHGHEPEAYADIPDPDEIAEMLNDRVLGFASDYTNRRIRAYLDRDDFF